MHLKRSKYIVLGPRNCILAPPMSLQLGEKYVCVDLDNQRQLKIRFQNGEFFVIFDSLRILKGKRWCLPKDCIETYFCLRSKIESYECN